MNNIFSSLSLKTKLLFMMVSLFFLLTAFMFLLYAKAEEDLVDAVRHHTEELSTAIQISIEEMSKSKDAAGLDKFKGIMNFKKKGIKNISVVNSDRDVIASSDPHLIGKKLTVKGESVKNIGNVTEYTTTTDGQKRYDIVLPVVMGKQKLGYIHIETQFDDFADIARANHRNRLIATLAIFSIGLLIAMFLSRKYTEPIQSLAEAAQKVASGDLSVRLKVERLDEIGRLTQNFNDMVRKLNESHMLEARLKEAEHMSKIGTLASGIAHEVRNPLNLINLSIDHLRAVYSPEDPVKKEVYLTTIGNVKSEIERLNGMVTNFLNFGRPLNLKLKKMTLEPVIEETIAFVSESCSEQKIMIDTKLSPEPACVMADYRHIKTCFLNIILNAMQAISGGGVIAIETGLKKGFVFVRIEDDGCGIGPENIQKVFEPYFTTKDIGIGLGLAMTKRVIEEHGGSITIESVLGKGTGVTVTLPSGTGA